MATRPFPSGTGSEQWHRTGDGSRVRAGLFRPGWRNLEPPGLATPGEELLLVVQVHPTSSVRRRQLRVELYRGDALRDVHSQEIAADSTIPVELFLGLASSLTPGRSARLTCRVQFDGVEIARTGVLLATAAADAQGRFACDLDTAGSSATLLAFADLLAGQLQRPQNLGT
jgi:hypothetical protein